jgi:hypothetical protein
MPWKKAEQEHRRAEAQKALEQKEASGAVNADNVQLIAELKSRILKLYADLRHRQTLLISLGRVAADQANMQPRKLGPVTRISSGIVGCFFFLVLWCVLRAPGDGGWAFIILLILFFGSAGAFFLCGAIKGEYRPRG